MLGQVIFIESICTIPELIENNIHQTILRSPEYRDMPQVRSPYPHSAPPTRTSDPNPDLAAKSTPRPPDLQCTLGFWPHIL